MFRNWMLAIGWLSVSVSAAAEDSWASRDYDYASRQLNDFVSRFERDLVNPVSRGVRASRPSAAIGSQPVARPRTMTTVAPRSPLIPKAMAAAYPAGQRARAEQTFEQLLAGYQQIEQRFDIARYDVAGAVAAFVAGSYMGYHNTGFPDQQFKPLVEQMRRIIGADAGFVRAPDRAKQDMYEQLAILGMLVANTQMALQQKPDAQAAAAMRQAAKGYLEQFLRTDAERVHITAEGLVIR
jgi:hypothetical protein